jgi:hypothetical protein
MTRNCEYCGSEFRTYPSIVAKGHGRFCSRRCVDTSHIGDGNPKWRGGVYIGHAGYRSIFKPEHPYADVRGYVMEHRLVAEAAIGFYLPLGVPVHHFDLKTDNNARTNLVVCEDHAYHMILHFNTREVAHGAVIGVTKWCPRCRSVLPRETFGPRKDTPDLKTEWCRACIATQARVRWQNGYAERRRAMRKSNDI